MRIILNLIISKEYQNQKLQIANINSIIYTPLKEVKNFKDLLENYYDYMDHNLKSNSSEIETIAMIPFSKNKYICFSCENLKNIKDNTIAVIDLLESSYSQNLVKSTKEITIEKNPLLLNIFNNICKKKIKFDTIIYYKVKLPNKSFLFLGLIEKIPKNYLESMDQQFAISLIKLYNNNFELMNCEKKKMNFNHIFEIDALKSNNPLMFYDKYFEKYSKYEKIKIKINVRKNSESLIKFFYSKNNCAFNITRQLKKFGTQIFMNNNIVSKTLINEEFLLNDLYSLNFNQDCFFDESKLEEIFDLDFKEKPEWSNALIFCINISETFQIIVALVNVLKFYINYERASYEINSFSQDFYKLKLKSLEKNCCFLEKLYKKISNKIIKKDIMEIFKYFNSQKKKRTQKLLKLFQIWENILKRKFVATIKKILKLEMIIGKIIDIKMTRHELIEIFERKKILKIFSQHQINFFKKRKLFFLLDRIFKSSKQIIKMKYFLNLQNNFHKSMKIECSSSFFQEYEEKFQKKLKFNCKIGLIINKSNSLFFFEKKIEGLHCIKIRNSNLSKNNKLQTIEKGLMIFDCKLKHGENKLYCFKYDFIQYTIYIEFISNQILEKKIESNFQLFCLDHKVNFQNFFLKFLAKNAGCALMLK